MSTDLARRPTADDLPSTSVAAAITGALEGLRAIRTFISQEFHNKVDFGTIPGCGDKPTLFLPGAQKATMYYNAYPTFKVKERDLGNGHAEFRVRALLISRTNGQQIGEGIGCASTKEKKFQRSGGQALKTCPSCGKAAVMKSKDKPEYFCWRKKDGCGQTFNINHSALQAPAAEADNDAPYEVRNTVLKMAKKRAHVDAAMTLGCLSELFTQDIEDTFPMVEVRDVARPEREEHHVNGEVIDADYADAPPRAPSPTAAGSKMFTKEHVEKTKEFNGWLSEQCKKINAAWAAEWKKWIDEKVDDGYDAPAKIDDVINPWQAKGHLLKWAVESERLDPTIIPEEARTRQADALVALVFYKSREDKNAIVLEMGAYLKRQRELKSDAIYRKFPHLAPDGYAESKAIEAGDSRDIAAPADRGDAYEEPEEALANSGRDA